ncbi:MAG: hypothetical protein ACREHE_15040 [Rhizomicrobium sp.]
MLRGILGAIAGVVTWFVAITVLGLALRYSWPDYAAVEKAMTFTVPMMAARLAVSGIGSLTGGYVASLISRERLWAALGAGVILLVPFVPYHLTTAIWSKFPVWYHLTFFVSLPLLSVIGARFRRG